MNECDRFGNVGKVATIYKPPTYHTSNFVRKLAYQNHSISSDNRIVLDFYGELESMRHRYAKGEKLPSKSNLPGKPLHEIMGDISHQAFATLLGSPIHSCQYSEVDRFGQALELLEVQPRVAHFLLCAAKANTLQEYCWPVRANPSPTMRKLILRRKGGFISRDLYAADRMGESALNRYLLLTNEIKAFTPRLTTQQQGGHLYWGESFHVLPQRRYLERELRTPPTVLTELARKSIRQNMRDDYLLCTLPRKITKKYPMVSTESLNSVDGEAGYSDNKKRTYHEMDVKTKTIRGDQLYGGSVRKASLEGLRPLPLPTLHPIPTGNAASPVSALLPQGHSRQGVLSRNSFGRNKPHHVAVKSALQQTLFENALARHLEAGIDSVLEAIFQFYLPLLEIAESQSDSASVAAQAIASETLIDVDDVQFVAGREERAGVTTKLQSEPRQENGVTPSSSFEGGDQHTQDKSRTKPPRVLDVSIAVPHGQEERVEDLARQRYSIDEQNLNHSPHNGVATKMSGKSSSIGLSLDCIATQPPSLFGQPQKWISTSDIDMSQSASYLRSVFQPHHMPRLRQTALLARRLRSAIREQNPTVADPNGPGETHEEPLLFWVHVLTALSSLADFAADSQGDDSSRQGELLDYVVHPSLPPLPLDRSLLDRITHRLVHLCSDVSSEHVREAQTTSVLRSEVWGEGHHFTQRKNKRRKSTN